MPDFGLDELAPETPSPTRVVFWTRDGEGFSKSVEWWSDFSPPALDYTSCYEPADLSMRAFMNHCQKTVGAFLRERGLEGPRDHRG